jgi:allantoin racemase
MKIKIIVPITLKSFQENATIEYGEFLKKGCMFKDLEYDVEVLEKGKGPLTIESEYDGALAEQGAISLVEKAEKEGYDGVVIDCFCDAGYHPAREAVGIPVVGAFETSIRFAQLLGNSIGIVTMKDTFIPRIHRMARGMKADDAIVSVTSLDIAVADLGTYKAKVIDGLEEKMIEAIEKKGADVLVLGCTGMMGVAASVQQRLNDKGYDVPVVNPAEACLRFMECLLVMGIKQSGIAYPRKIKRRWEA